MCYIPELKVSEAERELLEKLLVAAKTSQAVLGEVFQQRSLIQDRGLYWALGRAHEALGYLIRLTEIILKSA